MIKEIIFPASIACPFGLIIRKKPWKPSKWHILRSVFCIGFNLLSVVFWLEYLIRKFKAISSCTDFANVNGDGTCYTTEQAILSMGSSIVSFATHLLLRAIYFLKTNEIVSFLGAIERESNSIGSGTASTEETHIAKLYATGGFINFLIRLIDSILTCYSLAHTYTHPEYISISSVQFFIVLQLCMGWAIVSTLYLTFAFIMSCTCSLVRFITKFEHQLEIYFTAPIILNQQGKDVGTIHTCFATILKHYDQLKSLLEMFDSAFGSLLLVFILRTVIIFIQSTNDIIYGKKKGMNLVHEFFSCPQELMCLIMLLELGERVKRKVKHMKQAAVRLSCNFILKERHNELILESNKLLGLIQDFSWDLCAWSYFQINRKLMAGIVATALTYSVVIFQIYLGAKSSTYNNNNCSCSDSAAPPCPSG